MNEGFFSSLLVSCLRSSLTKSSDTGKDFISGFGLDKWFRVFIRQSHVLVDGCLQCTSAAMGPAFDLSFGEHGKPALHQIEPRGTGRGKVQMKAGALGKPAMNQRGFVSPVVVQDQVNLKCWSSISSTLRRSSASRR